MRISVFLFIQFLLLTNAGAIVGQPISYLGIEQGLSNNTVTSIYKDKHGFMWFGTFDGLNRYDGYGFTKFRNQIGDDTTLPDNYITAIGEMKDGSLWVGTKKGIGILNEKTFQFTYLKFQNPGGTTSSTLSKPVNSFKESPKDGDTYIATSGSGLLILKHKASAARQIPLRIRAELKWGYAVSSLNFDKRGILWLVTEYGLCYYDAGSRNAVVVNPNLKNSNSIKFDSEGNGWISTSSGMLKYVGKTGEIIPFQITGFDLSSSRIFDFCFDYDNLMWTATDGDGVLVIDVKSKTISKRFRQNDNASLLSNSIYTVFIDDENRKWIGTIRGGVNIIDAKKNRFKTIKHEPYNPNSLIHNTVMAFCEDGDDIWIGTDGGGISIWNRKLNTFKHHVFKNTSYGANQITSIIKDGYGDIWISTYGSGVKKFNRITQSFVNIPFVQSDKSAKYVWRLYLDADKKIWAGCIKGRWAGELKRGLFRYDAKLKKFSSKDYPVHAEIVSIADDNRGNLWLGTLSGVLKLDKKSFKVSEYNLESYVRALKIDKKGTVWMGTIGRGLCSISNNLTDFKCYNENNGLPNNSVVNIEQDESGLLWLGTFNGLSRFDSKSLSFENFYISDGLQSNQFNYNASLHLSSGEMMFGGIKGFNYFHPKDITSYTDFPPILVTGMRVLNSPVNADSDFLKNSESLYEVGEIVLPYEKSMFSLDFVALEYSLPDKIQYSYYMKGWDKAWNYLKNQHSLSYSRLNEGTYTLEIKATNASGLWNKQGRIIKVIILPPWYRSWWAYCIYLGMGGGMLYGYLYYQKRQARLLYEVELAKLKAAQDAELNDKKISFFTNISHELRTPLTLIVNPIKDLLNNDGKNVNLVDVSSVYRNTRRLLSLVDQLLLFKSAENELSDLKPEVLDGVEVCNEVFLCFNNQVKSRNIRYSFSHETSSLEIFADREKIEIVLFNLLSNAIKFTPDAGAVSFDIVDRESEVEILIADSGPGIPHTIGDKLFDKFYRLDQSKALSKKSGFGIGLFVSKLIAEKQGGSLSYESVVGKGTTFRYILPKNLDTVSLEDRLEATSKSTHLLTELITESHEDHKVYGSTVSESMLQVYDNVVSNKPNVLLIDDDSELRNYVRQILTEYTVFEADSAELGLELIKKSEPDIIICDVVMQGMSGVEFCSQIKSSRESSYIPVILLTGTSSPDIKLKGIECGADDYITKPFEKELFLARIKGILKGRESLKRYFFNEVTLQNNNEKVSEEYSLFLRKCVEIVEKHLQDDQFNVKVFVSEMGMSHSNLFRKVKFISGLSISEFIRYLRLKRAAEIMIGTDIQVKEVAYKVGMQDIRYFRDQFTKLFGQTPSAYIKKYRRTFLRAPGNHSSYII